LSSSFFKLFSSFFFFSFPSFYSILPSPSLSYFFLFFSFFHKPKQNKTRKKIKGYSCDDATSNGNKHNDVMKKKCFKKDNENKKRKKCCDEKYLKEEKIE
jgi:hypothetical protein